MRWREGFLTLRCGGRRSTSQRSRHNGPPRARKGCNPRCTGASWRLRVELVWVAARRTLYILQSFSCRSFLDTPARPGWITSTTCRRGRVVRNSGAGVGGEL